MAGVRRVGVQVASRYVEHVTAASASLADTLVTASFTLPNDVWIGTGPLQVLVGGNPARLADPLPNDQTLVNTRAPTTRPLTCDPADALRYAWQDAPGGAQLRAECNAFADSLRRLGWVYLGLAASTLIVLVARAAIS